MALMPELVAFDPRTAIDPAIRRIDLHQPRHIAMRRRDRGYDHGSAAVTDPEAGDDEDVMFVRLLPTDARPELRIPNVPLLGWPETQED